MIARLLGLPTISPRELQALVCSDDSVIVYDLNGQPSWSKAHVPGARHLDPQQFDAGDPGAASGSVLVFYCSGPLCRKAPLAARRARRMGSLDVRVMTAGLRGWLDLGLPVERGTS